MDERQAGNGLPMNKPMKSSSQEKTMRSELVHTALNREPNCYALCHLIAKATRALHRPNTRLQDTMNEALQFLAQEQPQTKSRIVEIRSAESLRAA